MHLLKVHGWPDSTSRVHWQVELVACQQNAARRFAPSMRQRVNVARLYQDALQQLDGVAFDGVAPRPWPMVCAFTLDELLHDPRAVLETRLVTQD